MRTPLRSNGLHFLEKHTPQVMQAKTITPAPVGMGTGFAIPIYCFRFAIFHCYIF